MLPQNHSARSVLIFAVAVIAVLSLSFRKQAAPPQATYFAYCASSPDQVVYMSEVFNTGQDTSFIGDPTPIQNEYNEYLKGRFDIKSNAALSVGCPVFYTQSQTQSAKHDYEAQMRRANNQIVEVEWAYRPEPGRTPSTLARPGHSITAAAAPQADHTFCISDPYQGTVYFTGPIATPPPVAMYQWINGFTEFLKAKYSFQGRVYCNMGTTQVAQRLVNAHLEGSRAAGHRVVETGWKYDVTQITTTSPSRPAPDEDREPAHRPAAQPPNLQARDFALQEHARSHAYCIADRVMAAAFDCQCLQRLITQYRLDHVSDTLSASPTPLEELFKGEKFDCKSCIQADWKFKTTIKSVAHIPSARQGEADCVVEKMRTLLEAHPYPSQAKEFLNQAVTACQ